MKGHDTRELRIGERILDRRSVCNLRGGKGVHILRGELWRYKLHNDQCSPPSTRDRWPERGTMFEGWTRCTSKRRSRDRVPMRLMHSKFTRTVIAAARAWLLETARGRSGTSWRVGEVGKHGPLFLFDLTRKGGSRSKTSWKVEDRWKEYPGSRVFTNFLQSIDGRLTFPLLEMLVLRPSSVLVTSLIVVARHSSSSGR